MLNGQMVIGRCLSDGKQALYRMELIICSSSEQTCVRSNISKTLQTLTRNVKNIW